MGGRGAAAGNGWIPSTIKNNALTWAKSKIGSSLYGQKGWNRELFFGTVKCNQFVVHAYNYPNGGSFVNDKTPIVQGTPSRSMLAIGVGRYRYPSAKEIYDGRLSNFVLVKKPQLGDIAADGQHVGIVSGKAKTISASSITKKVVENNWGFYKGKPLKNMRFYRYMGEKRTTVKERFPEKKNGKN